MRIVLFEALLEEHVRDSLERSLRKLGHDVIAPLPGWRGSTFPATRQQKEWSATAADEIITSEPDLLVCFRPSALPASEVQKIRGSGITTVIWLSDDPVLYHTTYRHVVDQYDIVLNCGNETILNFYQQRHGISGVNFPFWTDDIACPHIAYKKQHDIAFLGNCFGDVRGRRYNIISALPGRKLIYGQVDKDPLGISAGSINDHATLMQNIGAAKIGFNIPQIFSDYKENPLNFPELARLGSFPIPSRVVQYASLGIPILTYGRAQAPSTFPEMLCGQSADDCADIANDLLSSPDKFDFHADAVHQRFVASYSADRRASFLEWLVVNNGKWQSLSVTERVTLYDNFDKPGQLESANPATTRDCSYDALRQPQEFSGALQPQRLLVLGSCLNGPTDIVACHIRALRRLGHSVLHLDPFKERSLLADDKIVGGGFGGNLLNAEVVLAHAKAHGASILIYLGGGFCYDLEGYTTLKQAGLCMVGVTLSDPDVQESVSNWTANLDLHFTNSRVALERYREIGQNAHLMQFAVDSAWLEVEVDLEPEWSADVICLGNGRPDRNEVMTHIASRFGNVKVYGRDWQLPGSGPVSGLDLLKASRSGLLHVNFPRTAKGFQNVKCGVFETIGSGGILLTEEFDELGSLFEYGKEIVSYRDTEDLCDKIETLLAYPELRDELRSSALSKLKTKHLYEHRWIEAWDHISERTPPQSDDISRLAVVIAGYDHRKQDHRIIIESIVHRLRSARPGVEISLLTDGSAPLGVQRIPNRDTQALHSAASAADVVIIPPEGILSGEDESAVTGKLFAHSSTQEGALLIEWADQKLDELKVLRTHRRNSPRLFGTSTGAPPKDNVDDEAVACPDSVYSTVSSEVALGEADLKLTAESQWLSIKCEPRSLVGVSFMLDRGPDEEANSALVQVQHSEESKPPSRDKTNYGHWNNQLGRCKFLPRPNQRGISKLEFTAPNDGELKLGFRLWKNSSDILMSRRIYLKIVPPYAG